MEQTSVLMLNSSWLDSVNVPAVIEGLLSGLDPVVRLVSSFRVLGRDKYKMPSSARLGSV